MFMDTAHVLAAMAALAQESRLKVFRLLVQAGPAGISPGKISEALAIPASSLSFHLKELSHARLVTSTQHGRYLVYAANFDTMNGLIGFLTDNCCGGQSCTPACAVTAVAEVAA
jgi:ArsR family transcriptional regulator